MKSYSVTVVVLGIVIVTCRVISAATPADPCQSQSIIKLSVPVSITTSALGNIELISASSQSIHVCGFLIDCGGVGFAFVYGGGRACSTSPVPLTGTFLTNNPTKAYSGPGTIFSIPANNALCVNITSAPSSLQGVLTYTQP